MPDHMDPTTVFEDARGVEMELPGVTEMLAEVADLAEDNLPDDVDAAFGDDGIEDMGNDQATAIRMVRDAVTGRPDMLESLEGPSTSLEGELPEGDPGTLSWAVLTCARSARAMQPDPMTIQGVAAAEDYDRTSAILDFAEAFAVAHGAVLDTGMTQAAAPGV